MENTEQQHNQDTPAEANSPQPEVVQAAPEVDYKKQSEQYLDQLVRLQAEFANFRKRSEMEKTHAIAWGRELMLEKIIQLADVMEQAVKYSRDASDVKTVQQGFEMVGLEINRFLKSEGVEILQTVGTEFDPHNHEAVEQILATNDEENNKVVQELQKGYKINGRLLRAARVKVAKKN